MDKNKGYGTESTKELCSMFNRAQNEYIEKFAAAYLKHTNIPPDEAVMNMQYVNSEGGKLKLRVWFERKNKDGQE